MATDGFETFRDPLLSLYQSAVSEVGSRLDRAALGSRGVRAMQSSTSSALRDIASAVAAREYSGATTTALPESAARDLSKLGIARVCAELALRYFKAIASGDERAVAHLRDEFVTGTCDPAWLTTLEQYRRYFGPDGKRKAIPYIPAAAIGPKVIEIKTGARVALVGDWGTGARPAMEVLRLLSADKPDVVIHLGDIYYSGTPTECHENFAEPINALLRRDEMIPVFTLSANHDMYCGGVGYYDLIRGLNPAPFTQPASFFCLRTADDSWQLLGMDTGLHDYNPAKVADALTYLEEEELAWHCDRIREFSGRTILLSHHQLFSAYSPIGRTDTHGRRSAVNPRLYEAFRRLNSSNKVAAWFWGHEHSLSVYHPFASLNCGRCVGYGAIPVSVRDNIYQPLTNLDDTPSIVDEAKLGTRDGVYNHGYANLVLAKGACETEYVEATAGGRRGIYNEVLR